MKLEKMNKINSHHYGFTLIELMIVVAVIAILAAVAYPSYQESVRKTKRADGKALLLTAAQLQERHFTQYLKYATSLNSGTADKNLVINVDSENKDYKLTMVSNGTSFTLTATPPTGSPQSKDTKCKTFTLNNLGVRGYTGTGSTSDCW